MIDNDPRDATRLKSEMSLFFYFLLFSDRNLTRLKEKKHTADSKNYVVAVG